MCKALLSAVVATTVIIAAIGGSLYILGRPRVLVHNTGTQQMLGAKVSVTGHTYAVGDLQPGQWLTVRVNPTGESSVALDFTDASNNPHHVDADLYIEGGYHDKISISVNNGAIAQRTQTRGY